MESMNKVESISNEMEFFNKDIETTIKETESTKVWINYNLSTIKNIILSSSKLCVHVNIFYSILLKRNEIYQLRN